MPPHSAGNGHRRRFSLELSNVSHPAASCGLLGRKRGSDGVRRLSTGGRLAASSRRRRSILDGCTAHTYPSVSSAPSAAASRRQGVHASSPENYGRAVRGFQSRTPVTSYADRTLMGVRRPANAALRCGGCVPLFVLGLCPPASAAPCDEDVRAKLLLACIPQSRPGGVQGWRHVACEQMNILRLSLKCSRQRDQRP